MGRVLIASILAAVVIFAWGIVAWPVLHLYSFAVKNLPNEQAMLPAFKSTMTEDGAYFFPGMPEEDTPEARRDWTARHEAGPVGMVLYRGGGAPAMHWSILARGFAINLAGAFVLASLLYGLRLRNMVFRLAFVILIVAFAMLISHGMQWNWFHVPDNYTMAMMIDGLVGWTLGGIVLAAAVKTPKVT